MDTYSELDPRSLPGVGPDRTSGADRVIVRLILEIARRADLGSELGLEGGAALHWLHLVRPLRSTPDLEYARASLTPIGPVFDALRRIAGVVGFRVARRAVRRDAATIVLSADHPVLAAGAERVRIGIDTRPTSPRRPAIDLGLADTSLPGGDEVAVRTFPITDVAATCMRSLWLRRRERDLYDVWVAVAVGGVDPHDVGRRFGRYLAGPGRCRQRSLAGLRRDLDRRRLLRDLSQVVDRPESGYDVAPAADLVGRHVLRQV